METKFIAAFEDGDIDLCWLFTIEDGECYAIIIRYMVGSPGYTWIVSDTHGRVYPGFNDKSNLDFYHAVYKFDIGSSDEGLEQLPESIASAQGVLDTVIKYDPDFLSKLI